MNASTLWVPIVVPSAAAVLVLLAGRRFNALRAGIVLAATLINLIAAALMFKAASGGADIRLTVPWAGMGLDLALRLYAFSAFILLATAGFALLVALYCWKFMADRPHGVQFYVYLLLAVAMANGAVLADHLVAMLFFWEGMLMVTFGLISIGRRGAWRTAVKAFIIVGVSDLCLMMGIALAGWKAGTLTISQIHLAGEGLGALAMVLLMIGAIAKAGSMPFHSWIPDAAVDAPLPFMAFLPASLEKLLGIYFLTRIVVDMFRLPPQSWLSTLMMIVGAVTILLAVAMALVQKNYKRLLSYHAISQVGYMVLGVGTALPVGIIGGLFHMINNALYKSCLFFTGGSVEHRTGTTDLTELGGLGRKMPLTFLCYIITAASISGVPLTNGFYSKELVYEGALHRGLIFYLAAVVGTFLTAASFLKLGHAAYLGRRNPQHDTVKESPWPMLVPMLVIAGACLVFGLYNALPLRYLIQPGVAVGAERDFAGLLPHSWMLAGFTTLAITLAILNHIGGTLHYGSGLHAVDHIYHAPVLWTIYDKAAKRWFDPYDWGLGLVGVVGWIGWKLDRLVDWIYDGLVVNVTGLFTRAIRLANTGSYSLYVLWCLGGAVAVVWFLIKAL